MKLVSISSHTCRIISSTPPCIRCSISTSPFRFFAKIEKWRKVEVKSTGKEEEGVPDDSLASEFSKYLLENEITTSRRRPSHLMSPTSVITAQMNALQRNDWPEDDAGIKTVFEFTKPQMDSVALVEKRRRTWLADEQWLLFEEFAKMLHEQPYTPLLNFDEWEAISEVIFPSRRKDVAVQAVRITTEGGSRRDYVFTFCLERILEGSYQNCWMTSGVRFGDYST